MPSLNQPGDITMMPAAKFQRLLSNPAMEFQQSVMNLNQDPGEDFFSSGHGAGMWGMTQRDGSGFHSQFEAGESREDGGIFDEMALPDYFLGQYWGQVRNSLYLDSSGESSRAKESSLCLQVLLLFFLPMG